MRSAPTFGTFSFFLSLSLLIGAAFSDRAEAAPKIEAQSSASSSSAKAGGPSGKGKGSASSKARSNKSLSAEPAAAGAASGGAAPEGSVDPWEGRGAPADGSDPSAAEPPVLPEAPPEPPPEEPPMDPRTAYHKGNAAFREGRFTAARHYYRRALEGDTSFDVLCNLGRAEAELKDNVPAYVHLTHCVDAYPRDPELSATRASFSTLREDVRDRLTQEQFVRAEELILLGPPKPVVPAAPVAATAAPAAPPPLAPDVDLGPRNPGLRNALTITMGSLALVGVGGGIGFYVYSMDLGTQAQGLRDGIQADGELCPAHDDCAQLGDTVLQSDQMQHVALGSFIAAGGLATAAVLTYVLWPHEYGPARSALGPSRSSSGVLGSLRPSAAFDPARGSMWLGASGRF